MSEPKIKLTAEDKTRAAFESAKRNLGGLSSSVSMVTSRLGLLSIAGSALSSVTLVGIVKSSANVLDQLDKMREKTGMSVEALSGLRFAGELSGVSLDTLGTGVRKLSTNMAEAASGNKVAQATFRELGVEVKNADGTLRKQEEVLADIADRFAKYDDGAGKSAMSSKVFGDRVGTEMIPLLNQGSAGLKRMTEEAKALGVVYGGDLAKDAVAFNDNLTKMKATMEGLSVAIAKEALPWLNRLSAAVLRNAKDFGILRGAVVALYESALGGTDPADVIERQQKRIRSELAETARQIEIIQKAPFFLGDRDKRTKELSARMAQLQAQEAANTQELAHQLNAASGRTRFGRGVGFDDPRAPKQPAGMPPPAPGAGGAGNAASKEIERELKQRAQLLAELSGVQADYTESLVLYQRWRREGALTEGQYLQAVQMLIEKQPMARKLIEEATAAEKDLIDTRQRAADLQDRYLSGLAAESEAIMQRNASLAEEIEELGLTTEALEQLQQQRLANNIERERENLIAARNKESNEIEVAQIERRIRLLEEELRLKRQHGSKRIQVEAKEAADRQSEEFAATLHGDLKGAFARAFEDSKNPAEAFAKGFASVIYSRVSAALADALATDLLRSLGFKVPGGAGGLGGLAGGISGSLTSSFSQTSLGASGFGSGLAYGNMDLGLFLHGGGIAGSEATFRRPVNDAVFRGAPKYHTGGLAGDEVPAILKRGEGVFTPGQMKALGEGGAGGGFNLTLINQGAPLAVQSQQRISDTEFTVIVNTAVEKSRAAVAADMANPSSRVSQAVGRHTSTRRQR